MMKINKKNLRCLFLWLLVINVSTGYANLQSELPTTDPLSGLIFIVEEYKPLNYLDDNGQLTGLSVEVLLGAAKIAGSSLAANNINILPWARGYKLALNKKM